MLCSMHKCFACGIFDVRCTGASLRSLFGLRLQQKLRVVKSTLSILYVEHYTVYVVCIMSLYVVLSKRRAYVKCRSQNRALQVRVRVCTMRLAISRACLLKMMTTRFRAEMLQ